MHAGIWGTLGAIGGLAFAIGLGSTHRLRLVLLGLTGACLATAIYEVLGAVLDADALTTDPISKTWFTRMTARMLVALGTAAAISLSQFPGTEPKKTAKSKDSRLESKTGSPTSDPE